MTYCTATRRNGEPCRAQALPDQDLCWAHSPGMRQKAAEARRRGGENKANVVRAGKHIPRDMKELARRLLKAIDEVHRGEFMPDQARAMASLAGAVCRVYEAGEVEQRIAELEARLEAQPAQAWRR